MPGAGALADLARAEDLQRLERSLVSLGLLPEEISGVTAPALDLALRREAGRTLAIVRRWLGPRAPVVAVALDAEDRRSLRALIRGAAAGVHADARLSGLIPTPTLPERLMGELASRLRIGEQAALLVAARHPYGPALLAAAGAAATPDLFAIESAILRTFAARAVRGARRGGPLLRDHVRSVIDRENCRTALLLAHRGAEENPAPLFLSGGRLGAGTFERAAAAGDTGRAASILSGAFGGLDAMLIARHAGDLAALEEALEQEDLHRLERLARLDPLGPAPLLHFLQRLRLQSITLARVVWSVDLGLTSARAG
jgi:vacuolar-type H+-ATPase subunit C/Vma6